MAEGPQEPACSRLCIKNLPKHVTEARLREHFGVKGEVTDVKVLKTRDGQPRQMGFVGFRTPDQAAAALRYFNRTFLDANRLALEYARRYGDDAQPRPWSKYSAGSSRHDKALATTTAATAETPADAAAAGRGVKSAKKRSRPVSDAVETAAAGDPQLAEFLELMRPRARAKIWANDEVLPTGAAAALGGAAPGVGARAAPAPPGDRLVFEGDAGDSSDDEHPGGVDGGALAFAALPDVAGEGESDGEEEGAAAAADPLLLDAAVSDLDYLRARVRPTLAGEDEGDARDSTGSGDGDGDVDDGGEASDAERDGAGGEAPQVMPRELPPPPPLSAQLDASSRGDQAGVGPSTPGAPPPPWGDEAAAAEAAILETSRLFVRNLAFGASEADLAELFGGLGDLEEVHLVLDRDTKRSRGTAHILYRLPEDAVKAYRQLDRCIFQGRLLHVLPGQRHPTRSVMHHADNTEPTTDAAATDADGASGAGEARTAAAKGASFKAQREAERKATAGNRAAWNTLFMRADTVAEAVAAHYGVTKRQLLDKESGDLAVRMALGEAQVIAQTKEALAEAGVAVERLEAAAAASGHASASKSVSRSASALLVKNLPYSANEAELGELFGRCGPVARLVLPPTRAVALVEFAEPQDARAAFKTLAYKRYHQVPLYLEWAPSGIFDGPPPARVAAAAVPAAAVAAAAVAPEAVPVPPEQGAGDNHLHGDDGSRTIYVKNLAFSTGEKALGRHFARAVAAAAGRVVSARVARRKGADGALLSMGYGFVECDSEAVARAVIKQLQGSLLEKHELSLQLSQRRPSTEAVAAAKRAKPSADPNAAAAKLVVRNVAFEATKRDLMGLFGPFGHVKSCRLPKKMDGQHRGFAFVEFVTAREARAALEGVGGTHLYGRRLVVEYAEAEEGLTELRAKTAAQFERQVGGSDADGAGDAEGGGGGAAAVKRMKKGL